MTIEEAIERIHSLKIPITISTPYPISKSIETNMALDMAISALLAQHEAEKNEPLTQAQLRNMNNEEVFCEELNTEVTVKAPSKGLIEIHYFIPGSFGSFFAKDVTLYRRHPESK